MVRVLELREAIFLPRTKSDRLSHEGFRNKMNGDKIK